MKTLRTLFILAATLLLVLVPAAPPVSAQQLLNEPLVKNLISLGLAGPATGKLLSGSLIDPTTVTGGTTQSTDNLLNTVSLDDEMLALRGRGMLIIAWGTTATNGNTKDLKLKYGGTAIMTIADSTASAKDFLFVALIVRDGVDTERGTGFALVDGALVAATSINISSLSVDQNATAAIITTADNNSAAASAATGKGLVVIPIG